LDTVNRRDETRCGMQPENEVESVGAESVQDPILCARVFRPSSCPFCTALQSNPADIYAVQIPVTFAFVWAEGSRLIKHTEIGEQEGGVVWTKVEVIMYPAYAFVAGTLVGMLGIGGGMLINPLLLELGVIPQVRIEKFHLHEKICHCTSGGCLQVGNVRGHAWQLRCQSE
jgi:hypothetical protein